MDVGWHAGIRSWVVFLVKGVEGRQVKMVGCVFPLAVLAHGHSVYAGILVLIFDVQSNVDDFHVIRY